MAVKQTVSAWRTAAVDTAPLVEATEGDGLNNLRTLQAKYLAKARYIELLGHDPSTYLRSAVAVGLLLG